MTGAPSERVQALLLLVASCSLGLAVFLGVGWLRAARSARLPVQGLSQEERFQIAREILAQSPGIHVPTLYAPEIGFTLRPSAEIDAWNDRFTSNELGYRAAAVAKPPGTFRVVFLGDSWTYGMGVAAAEAFPAQWESLANRSGGLAGKRIQSWALALPGYNSVNEAVALQTFYDLLKPDAVVICPTVNDADSNLLVLPNGSLGFAGLHVDVLGDRMPIRYQDLTIDSHKYVERFVASFGAIRKLETMLAARGVPLFVFFTAFWPDAFAHYLVAENEIEAPYVFTPAELVGIEWMNDLVHPNARAHRAYAELLYDALAPELGLGPRAGDGTPSSARPQLHRRSRAGSAWKDACRQTLRAWTFKIPSSFSPGNQAFGQCPTLLNPRTGLMGRRGYVLVRRVEGAVTLRVVLSPLQGTDGFYPVRVHLEIPSPSGRREASTLVGTEEDRVEIRIDIPPDIPPGSAIDVLLEAERITYGNERQLGGSVFVLAVDQAGADGTPLP